MSINPKKQIAFLIICVIIIALAAAGARLIETDFGKLDVSIVKIQGPMDVTLVGKLYRPSGLGSTDSLPAVLILHGFQNDKETMQPQALELARRGFVTLALDQLGHGSTGGSMAIKDATMGGDHAYKYLQALPYVDATRMGVMGHSMGAGTTLAVAMANPDHRALNPMCGTPGSPDLNNVMLTQAKYEEFRGFRANQPTTVNLPTNPERLEQFGLSEPVNWDTTYGKFSDGSARMQTLVNTVHPGVTHNAKAVSQAILWMQAALKDGQVDSYWLDPHQQIFMWKEAFMFLALLTTLVSMIPMANLLLLLPFFAGVSAPVPNRYVAGKNWKKQSIINNLIAGITFPLLMGVGGYLLASVVPGLSMIIANGAFVWFLGNAVIYFFVFRSWYKKAHKNEGVTMYDMGISFDEEKTVIRWDLITKTALLGFLLLGWMYLLVFISQHTLGIEFRLLWPFMREFSAVRFGYFWIYLFPALAFFMLNGGIFLFGQNRLKEAGTPTKTQFRWWLMNCVAGIAGLLFIWLFQYIPYFAGTAPGFELIGLPIFGEMLPLMLFVYIPEFVILFFFLTWFYRRTGKVYLGALVIAALAIWFQVAGTAM
ncbi:MAG: hypothetical protein BGO78_02830 [Chloroflexi bacterium 44-23]|nr:MAG: hypothetical protein BGO78_02830 [Chloroflexi bacterium 44-23]